jgi:hypothetical protein
MWRTSTGTRRKIGLVSVGVAAIAAALIPSTVVAEDRGTIVIIMQPASETGWANIQAVGGIDEGNIETLLEVDKEAIDSIGSIPVD